MRQSLIHRVSLASLRNLRQLLHEHDSLLKLSAVGLFSLVPSMVLSQSNLEDEERLRAVIVRTSPSDRLPKVTPYTDHSRRDPDFTPLSTDVIRLNPLDGQVESPVVTALSISADRSMMAAAGDDHAIRLVSLKNGKTLHTLIGHADWVQSLAFSPDSTVLSSCSNDGTVRLWSTGETPSLLLTSRVPHALSTLVFCGSHRLFVAGFHGNIYSLEFTSQSLQHPSTKIPLVIHRVSDCSDIRSLDCSPDNQWLACGGRDGILRVCSTQAISPSSESGSKPWEASVPLHFDRIRSVQFSLDGRTVTSVGEDRRILAYDLETQQSKPLHELPGGKLMALCQIDEQLMAVSGSDNTIRILDRNNASHPTKLIGHDGTVTVLQRCGDYLVSSGFDTTIRFWNIETAISSRDNAGRFTHPVAAQFENSGAGELVR